MLSNLARLASARVQYRSSDNNIILGTDYRGNCDLELYRLKWEEKEFFFAKAFKRREFIKQYGSVWLEEEEEWRDREGKRCPRGYSCL